MRILTIFARYGLDQYKSAEDALSAIVARQLPGVTWELVIVDNALPPESVTRAGCRTLLGGDNRVREFTAFDRAVLWAGPSLSDYDFVHFATSAFNTMYTAYLDRFSVPLLRTAAGLSVCLGHIDCYNAPVRVGSFLSQHWVRTGFFFLPPAQVKALGSFVSLPDGRAFFSGEPAAPFRADAPISENYRRYIIEWLTGQDIGQGVAWHSRLGLTPETLLAFEQKALCILNEQMLGVRLRALGCPLVDVTWLSTVIERTPAEQIPWHLVWRQQLAARDRDRITMTT